MVVVVRTWCRTVLRYSKVSIINQPMVTWLLTGLLDVGKATGSVSSLMAWQVPWHFSSKHVCQRERLHSAVWCSGKRKVSRSSILFNHFIYFCIFYLVIFLKILHVWIYTHIFISLNFKRKRNLLLCIDKWKSF